jgi:lipopolysaccharide/colanic/teichoic acid biosynthesis glycosyltransferase
MESMRFSKRLFDLILTSLGMIIIMPLMLVLSLLVWIFLGIPILFRQERPGYKGRPFITYKFRTMTNRTGPDGKLLPDAERLTPFGRFLRSTSLDDIPQVFNVLRGEMSLVGPRPLLMQYLKRYTDEQMRRHDVFPGITGWAQINGRNALDWQEKFRLDVWYVDHWSFWLDLKILFLTPRIVFRREGINQPGHATVEEYKGSGFKR